MLFVVAVAAVIVVDDDDDDDDDDNDDDDDDDNSMVVRYLTIGHETSWLADVVCYRQSIPLINLILL